ncbi:MAG: glycosyltransferase family 4 protein [Candidatus Doudnabacteria bacterium]|nr:glycosyltransferase family 4 protein [Candidatus Doudnabacteria bacterium]
MAKRIGLDIRIFGSMNGGIGRYAFELFTRILELDKENRYFLFYNKKNVDFKDLESFKKFPNAEPVETSVRHYSIAEQSLFVKTLNDLNLDLVHFPNFNVPFFYKKPYVVTIHDMVHHKISGNKKSHLLHFYAYKKIIENAAIKAKKIITISDFSKQEIIKYLNADPQKISVIYEGTSLGTNVEESFVAEVKKRYLLSRPYFLFVGVLERKKNIINLTRGFDYFLQKYKLNVDLVIAGKIDKHYPEIKHKAMDIKHQNHLVFTGYVDDDELRALYKGAYAYASASLHEGFGLPGVEALSFGLPLLVSNLPVFNEVYDNAALYFNPLDPKDIGEKMNLLVRDNQFYSQVQEKSHSRSLFFDWNKTARETLAIYKQNL